MSIISRVDSVVRLDQDLFEKKNFFWKHISRVSLRKDFFSTEVSNKWERVERRRFLVLFSYYPSLSLY